MDDSVITLHDLDDDVNIGCMRGRSRTWSSFSSSIKPISPLQANPFREESIEDIYNDLLQSASEFTEKSPDESHAHRYEDLSDIEEGVQSVVRISQNDDAKEVFKKKSDLSKLCGYQSYHHMIEKAISVSPNKMLTLNQIYEWIEANVPYFRSLTEDNKAKSWKNSVRHNLSLHKQFYRVLRDGHRSCSWACDMSRVQKDKARNEKRKLSQPQQHSPPSTYEQQDSPPLFRPRARTDPNMIRPIRKPENLRSYNKENLVKHTYSSLSSRFAAIEVKTKHSSFEHLPHAGPSEYSSNIPSNLNHDQKAKSFMNVYGENSNSPPNLAVFHSTQNLSTDCEPTVGLDIRAIIEHEKNLCQRTYENPS